MFSLTTFDSSATTDATTTAPVHGNPVVQAAGMHVSAVTESAASTEGE